MVSPAVLGSRLDGKREGNYLFFILCLVPAWLRLCNDNIVELLYALDVGISDGKIASDVLNVLFKSIPFRELTENFNYIDNNKLIPFEKLTPETAVYWKNVTKYLFKEGGGAHDCLEKLLPELTQFCAYLRHYVIEIEKPEDDLTWVFIAKQLIEMTGVFDLADEVGRNNLGLLCKDLMAHKKVTTPFIEPLMEIFTTIRTNTDARIQEVTEIIAELRDPMKEDKTGPLEEKPEAPGQANNTDEASSKSLASADDQRRYAMLIPFHMVAIQTLLYFFVFYAHPRKQVQIAQVRVQLNILKNDMEEAVQNKDFLKAQNIKIEMEKLDIEQNQLQEELTEATAMAAKPNSANNSRHQVNMFRISPRPCFRSMSRSPRSKLFYNISILDNFVLILHNFVRLKAIEIKLKIRLFPPEEKMKYW